MNKYPDLTYTILSSKAFPDEFSYDLAVDWAYEMLEHGYEMEDLLILAATTKPTNQFECGLYLERAIEELGLTYIQGEYLVVAACWRYIRRIASSIDVSANLTKVHEIAYPVYYSGPWDNVDLDKLPLGVFCLLYWAWGEPDQDGLECYWDEDDVTHENIENYISYKAKLFIKKYEPLIESLLPQ